MILLCDVCDKQFSPDSHKFWASVDMPGAWTVSNLERDDERLTLDVCSPECMYSLGKVFEPEPSGQAQENDDEPVRAEPEPRLQPMQYPDVTVR